MLKRPLVMIAFAFLILFGVAGCGGGSATTTSQFSTPTLPPLMVTSLTTSVSPLTLAGTGCGSSANFVFTTIITIAQGSGGGTVSYTWTIGPTQIPGTVTFTSLDTSKTVTYTLANTPVDSNMDAVTGSLTVNDSGNGSPLTSAPVTVTGICSGANSFKVASIGLSISPASVSGVLCGSTINFVYTASVTVAPQTNGGTVFLKWSVSSATQAVLTFGPYVPGQTTRTVTATFTLKVPFHGVAGVSISSTSPNAITSNVAAPFGVCHH